MRTYRPKPDDNELKTPQWLESVGFENGRLTREFGYNQMEIWVRFDEDGQWYTGASLGLPQDGEAMISSDIATRGDVRFLCTALDIPLKGTEQEELEGIEEVWSEATCQVYRDAVKAVGGCEDLLWEGPTHSVWGMGDLSDHAIEFSKECIFKDKEKWNDRLGPHTLKWLGMSLDRLKEIPVADRKKKSADV